MTKGVLLIIDDDPETVRMTEATVDPEQYTVNVVSEVKAAAPWIKETTPDIIVLHADLPKGWRLCYLLKRSKRWSDIPLILLTATTTPEEVAAHQLESTRADAYLEKPLDAEAFSRSLRALIPDRLREANAPSAVAGGDTPGVLRSEPTSDTDPHQRPAGWGAHESAETVAANQPSAAASERLRDVEQQLAVAEERAGQLEQELAAQAQAADGLQETRRRLVVVQQELESARETLEGDREWLEAAEKSHREELARLRAERDDAIEARTAAESAAHAAREQLAAADDELVAAHRRCDDLKEDFERVRAVISKIPEILRGLAANLGETEEHILN